MGDFTTRTKIENRQERAKRIKEARKNDTIDFFTKEHKPGKKNKMISARVSEQIYAQFKEICDARGISANAQLNILICDYVMDYKRFLEK